MSDTATEAAKGTSILMSQAIVSGVFRVLNIAILTRLLLQEEMGQIAFLGIIYGFMQFLGALGLNHASPLVIPEEEQAGRFERVRGFLKRSLAIIILSSCGMVLFVLALSTIMFGSSGVPQELINIALVIAPFSAMEVFLDSFLLGRYTVRRLAVGRILFDGTRVAATVGLVLIGMGVGGVMFGWLAGELVAVFVFGLAAFRGLSASSAPIEMAPILSFALPNLLFQTIDVTIQNTDRVILLHLTDLASLGVYDVFLRILWMLSFVSLTISSSIYPILTRIRVRLESENESPKEMGVVVATLVRYVLILLVPVSIVVALNSHLVLTILFGSSYADFPGAAISFSLLILSYTLWGVVYALHTVLRSMGEARFFVTVGVSVIAFEIVGCWYLVSLFGIFGAALVRVLYIIILFVTAWIRLYQRGVSGVSPVAKSALRIIVVSSICGVLVLLTGGSSFVTLALSLGVAVMLYFGLMFVLREVSEFDFHIAISITPSRLHGPIRRIRRAYLGQRTERIS